jgi:CRP/FNR family cyclic AMP-dependent transcriptional regulator
MRKSLVLLGILNDSDVEWMLRIGNKDKIKAGSRLIVEGEPIGSLYIVLSGQFAVNVGGPSHRIATLSPGEILGEMSFIDSRPPSATVTADQDSWVLDIPRREVSERLSEEAAFGARFYRAIAIFLSTRLRDTVAHLGYDKPVQLDENVEDAGEIPISILDNINLAGVRFSALQERARAAAS